MKTQHTPGPWEVENSPYNYVKMCDLPSRAAKAYSLDNCGIERTPDKTDHANARLIAAAPELLTALETLRNEAAKLAERFDVDGPGFEGTAPIWAHLEDANEALNKATGEY